MIKSILCGNDILLVLELFLIVLKSIIYVNVKRKFKLIIANAIMRMESSFKRLFNYFIYLKESLGLTVVITAESHRKRS